MSVLGAVLPVFGLLLAGWLAGRSGLLSRDAAAGLNRYVIYLALPALLLRGMARVSWSQVADLGFLGAFGLAMTMVFGLGLWLSLRSGKGLADASLEALACAYANTAYMGVPLSLGLFGAAGLPPAIVASLLTVCILFAFALVLVEAALQREAGLSRAAAKVARALVRNPLVVSPFVGLAIGLSGLGLPGPVDRFLSLLGDSASACALVTLGLFLAEARGGLLDPAVWRLTGLKLALQPALTAILAFGLFHLEPMSARAAVLLAALPIGTGPFMAASLYAREVGVISRAVLVSTLGSVVTVMALELFWLPG